jgi:hypothetical protein
MRRSEALQGVRLIKFRDVLGRYELSELNQLEAAELLGVSERTFRRWCGRHEEGGEAGLLDRRLGHVSGKRCRATIKTGHVLPHPGMLPSGLSIASPECSRSGASSSSGGGRIIALKMRHATTPAGCVERSCRDRPDASGSGWRSRAMPSDPVLVVLCSATIWTGRRIASSRDAPERLEHCLTRMLPKRRLVVKRWRPDNRAQNAARADTGWLR